MSESTEEKTMIESTLEEGNKKTFTIKNPATGEKIDDYSLMNPEDVDRVVARAKETFETWSRTTHAQRREVLKNAADYLSRNIVRFSDEIALENGKTRGDALMEIFATIHLLHFYAKRAEKYLKPVRVPGISWLPFRKCWYEFEPKGVVAVISPWNYPFTLTAAPALTALAAGNSVVLKPSSQTTRSGLIFKEAMDAGGIPEDVVQVVTGTGSLSGQALIEHPGLDMIFFTGSTDVGREVSVQAAKRFIPAGLELGGKDVGIVTRTANLDRAAAGLIFGAFSNAGQTCMASEIILVDRAVYEPFMEKMIKMTSELELGKGIGQIGCMTMASQKAIAQRHLDDALAKGARVVATAKTNGLEGQGNWMAPRLLADVTPDMECFHEETFGPVKLVVAYDTIEEAISLANSVRYGLQGCVFTGDPEEGLMLARRIKTGGVNINDALYTYANPNLPFLGVKDSGIGVYHGKMGLQFFTDMKAITENKLPGKGEFFWFPVMGNIDKLLESLVMVQFCRDMSTRLSGVASMTREVIKLATGKVK